MLGEILKTLEAHRGGPVQIVPDKVPNKVPDKVPNKLLEAFPDIPAVAWGVYSLLISDSRLTTAQMSEALGVSDRMVRRHLAVLKGKGLITRVGSNKTGHWEISK